MAEIINKETGGEENKKYKRVDFTKIKSIEDVKLLLLAMYGEVALNPENPRFKEVEKRGLLCDEEFVPNMPTTH
jgi:hypothetical protein